MKHHAERVEAVCKEILQKAKGRESMLEVIISGVCVQRRMKISNIKKIML